MVTQIDETGIVGVLGKPRWTDSREGELARHMYCREGSFQDGNAVSCTIRMYGKGGRMGGIAKNKSNK